MQVSLSTARAAGHPHLSDFAVRTGGVFGLAVLLGILLCVKVDQPCKGVSYLLWSAAMCCPYWLSAEHFMMLHSPGRAVKSHIGLWCFYFMKLG